MFEQVAQRASQAALAALARIGKAEWLQATLRRPVRRQHLRRFFDQAYRGVEDQHHAATGIELLVQKQHAAADGDLVQAGLEALASLSAHRDRNRAAQLGTRRLARIEFGP